MAGNQDQKGRKNPGISTITRKEQHFTDNPTRLHPAILRVEEKVKKTNPELSRIHAAGNTSAINTVDIRACHLPLGQSYTEKQGKEA